MDTKKIPISIQIKEYIGSKFFFLTNKKIAKIIIIPIERAISLECKESIKFNFLI